MIQGFKTVCQAGLRFHVQIQSRYSTISIKDEWRKRRNIIFDNELHKQKEAVGRIEKISVKYQPMSENAPLIEMAMNKNLSTPDECARHLSNDVHKSAALALVDDRPWDMHRPFNDNCIIQILTMNKAKNSHAVNTAFWRSCSIVLGSMIESVFKDDISLYVHSFPWPNIKSGSYVYDVVLDLPEWKPTNAELRAMSAQFVKITNDALPFERLEVTEDIAMDMFQDNPFKSKQIPDIAKSNDDKVTLYRIGEYIDISKGPAIGNTSIIGKTTIAAVHKIESEETDRMYRFQGISIPRGIYLNHVTFGILENRARQLNETVWTPHKFNEEFEEQSSIAANN